MATTFSRTARSERHFTALLLPHLLMSNNFAGSRALFKKLGLYEGKAFDPSDIEIVAELNPMRDVVGRSTNPNAAPPGEQGQVVPDLFVRIGDSALSIEAKFFTHPSAWAVAYQLRSQRKAIEMVLPHTKYERCTFHYLVLTVLPLDDLAEWDANTSRMTWSEVIKVIETVINADSSPDAAYALEELRDAVKRSSEEANTSSKERGRVGSVEELLQQAKKLLDEGYRCIGFVGGERALANATVKDMEERNHYKYSDCQPSKNWIPLHLVICYYLKLRADVTGPRRPVQFEC